MSNNREPVMENRGEAYTFRWRYIALPVAILILSAVLVLIFYSRLSEQVAYRFLPDGSPERLTGRGTVILWTLLPQLLLTLAALAVTRGVTSLANRYSEPGSAVVKLEKILLLMGNMPALPQVIFGFAMLDIFSYNSSQVHLMPIWIFAVIVMVLGGLILTIFSFRLVLTAWRANKE